MDPGMLEAHMDPRDTGLESDDMDLKQALVWSEIEHDPSRWRGKGLPTLVESLMTEGARVPPPPGPPPCAPGNHNQALPPFAAGAIRTNARQSPPPEPSG